MVQRFLQEPQGTYRNLQEPAVTEELQELQEFTGTYRNLQEPGATYRKRSAKPEPQIGAAAGPTACEAASSALLCEALRMGW